MSRKSKKEIEVKANVKIKVKVFRKLFFFW
ncbi:hypothetical protein SRABI96_03399 [Peribacillus sp. Bi96]|nr:hypothetical protein SRABI96_03399 [Peribacillus sp. Bi96]